MKTPEELAWDYASGVEPSCCGTSDIIIEAEHGFCAGFKAAMPKWISVKERLPEQDQLVVVLHEDEMGLNHRKPATYFAKHNGKYWLEVTDNSDVAWSNLCKITHWLPLPEPPKDE
jgi:hypothetical protein